jgi:peptidoglycan/xylan/chitin deacetylase (PgdA/CDA1 family)
MKAITLGYHDVVEETAKPDPSDPRPQIGLYTLSESAFAAHLTAIQYYTGSSSPTTIRAFQTWKAGEIPNFLTFDDGALGSYTCAAGALESRGWRGHFFVATDWIGRPGFLDARRLRELHQRGHVIGSHSCSHPERMSELSRDELIRQWTDSRAKLESILGAPVKTASVPNGYYSSKVARTAAAAGVEVLFTSEPTSATAVVDGCLILGRYAVQRRTPAEIAGAIAAGHAWPRWRQSALWQGKKAAKALTGESYFRIRRLLLAHR